MARFIINHPFWGIPIYGNPHKKSIDLVCFPFFFAGIHMALAIWYIIFHVDFLSASKDGDVHCGYQWITEFLTLKKMDITLW
jgi:hypothetical protein